MWMDGIGIGSLNVPVIWAPYGANKRKFVLNIGSYPSYIQFSSCFFRTTFKNEILGFRFSAIEWVTFEVSNGSDKLWNVWVRASYPLSPPFILTEESRFLFSNLEANKGRSIISGINFHIRHVTNWHEPLLVGKRRRKCREVLQKRKRRQSPLWSQTREERQRWKQKHNQSRWLDRWLSLFVN